MKAELEQYVKKDEKDKIVVVHNLNDIDGIKEKANVEIEFQDDTFCIVRPKKSCTDSLYQRRHRLNQTMQL